MVVSKQWQGNSSVKNFDTNLSYSRKVDIEAYEITKDILVWNVIFNQFEAVINYEWHIEIQ